MLCRRRLFSRNFFVAIILKENSKNNEREVVLYHAGEIFRIRAEPWGENTSLKNFLQSRLISLHSFKQNLQTVDRLRRRKLRDFDELVFRFIYYEDDELSCE